MVVSEAHGLPVAFLVSPYSTHESQLAPYYRWLKFASLSRVLVDR